MKLGESRLGVYRAFLVAHARVAEAFDRELTRHGALPLAWYDVLVTLEYAEGHRLRMSDLAAEVLLSKSGLTRLVDRLVQTGYVRRHHCPSDRRVAYAVLTDEGKKAREASWPLYSELIAEAFGPSMSDHEAEVVRSVMERVAARVASARGRACSGQN